MKSTIISMLIVLVVLSVIPLLFFGDGKLGKLFGPGDDSGATRAKLPKNLSNVVTDKKVEVYKWRDEHGVMQFSNTPPADGGASSRVVLSPDTNVVKALKVEEEEPVMASGPKVYSLKNPYSVEGMKDMVESTKDIEEMMNQRQAEQDTMMEEIFNKK